MNGLAAVFVFCLLGMLACGRDGGPCREANAERVDGVCVCPAGSRTIGRACVFDADASLDAAGNASSTTDAGVNARPSGDDAATSGRVNLADAMARVSDADDGGRNRDDPRTTDGVDSTSDAALATPPNALGDTCKVDAQLRCTMIGSGTRQQCKDGHWTETEACMAGEVCDSAETSGGTTACRPVIEACKGNGDQPACDGAVMQFCGKSGLATRSKPCGSKSQCELGLAHGACAPCVPGTFRCSGATLEKCTTDGQSFESSTPACSSAALCNAQAGACTMSTCLAGSKTCNGDTLQTCNATLTGFEDTPCGSGLCDAVGRQCDVCVANTKSCDGNSVKTCNAQGQSYGMTRCPTEKPLCTGNGTCVQCEQATDCAALGECSVAACNTANGSCASTFKASGVPCSKGVCDGRGNCGPAPTCGDGIQNQATEECDDGNFVQEDDCLNNCKAATCGDGVLHRSGTASKVEQCDLSVQGSSPWKCSNDCKKNSMYTGCANDGNCSAGESCQAGLTICTKSCPTGGVFDLASGCPAPQKPNSGLRSMCTSGFVKLCVVTGCGSDSDCPDGSWCFREGPGDAADPNYLSSSCTNSTR